MANQKEIADWLDLSDKQVRNLQAKGILPKAKGRGQLDEKACVHSYIQYLRSLKSSSQIVAIGGQDDPDEVKESVDDRLKRLRADTLEFKLQIEQGKWAPIDFLADAFAAFTEIAIAKLGSLPAVIRMTAPDMRPSAVERITKEISIVQNSLTDIEITLPDYDECDYSDGEAFALATEDDPA